MVAFFCIEKNSYNRYTYRCKIIVMTTRPDVHFLITNREEVTLH